MNAGAGTTAMTVERAFTFSVGDEPIRGQWHVPASRSRRGIVMLHGFGTHGLGPRRLFVDFARRAAEAGWHVLRFDFRGRGQSDGSARRTDYETMLQDTVIACQEFQNAAELDRLSLLGICSGGTLAFMASKLVAVDSLVLWSPDTLPGEAVNLGTRWRMFSSRATGYARKLMHPHSWTRLRQGEIDFAGVMQALRGAWNTTHGKKQAARATSIGGQVLAGPNTAPTLIVHGDADPSASRSVADYVRVLEVMGTPRHLVAIRGADHNFYSFEARSRLIEATLDFLSIL